MQKNTSHPVGISIILLIFFLFACGQKKQAETTITPEAPKAAGVNCELWKANQTFMSTSYGMAHSEGDKIYINKLTILQLMNSLKLESDPTLQKVKEDLLDSIEHAPRSRDPLYTIEFRPPVIALRDRIAIGISNYIDKCPQ